MEDFTAQQTIADTYLEEMLQAEREQDHKAWGRRWLNNKSEVSLEIFQKDVEHMHEVLGHYQSREYLGALKGRSDESTDDHESTRLRFVWRVIFEKNEALYVVGIRQVDGTWYVYECPCMM